MIQNLLKYVKKNFTLKKENIKKSYNYVLNGIATPYSKLFNHSKNMKFDVESVKKRGQDLQKLMDHLDETMVDYHRTYGVYEKKYIGQRILDDISPYYKLPENLSLKVPIKKISRSVFLKKRRYEVAVSDYNVAAKELLNSNVRGFLTFF